MNSDQEMKDRLDNLNQQSDHLEEEEGEQEEEAEVEGDRGEKRRQTSPPKPSSKRSKITGDSNNPLIITETPLEAQIELELSERDGTKEDEEDEGGDTIDPTCYCGSILAHEEGLHVRTQLLCSGCQVWFHTNCLKSANNAIATLVEESKAKSQSAPWTWLEGDDNFLLKCTRCQHPSPEYLGRHLLSWIDVIHVALYHLSATQPPRHLAKDGCRYYHPILDICRTIERFWRQFWLSKKMGGNWRNDVAKFLRQQQRFQAVEMPSEDADNTVKMMKSQPDESNPESMTINNISRSRDPSQNSILYGLAILMPLSQFEGLSGRPKPRSIACVLERGVLVQEPSQRKKKDTSRQLSGPGSSSSAASSRRNAPPKFKETISDPSKVVYIYPDIENPVNGIPVVVSTEPTHTAPQLRVSVSLTEDSPDKLNIVELPQSFELTSEPLTGSVDPEEPIVEPISSPKTFLTYFVSNRPETGPGYRMAKSTHGVWEDSWYFEVKILPHTGHTRIGVSQISGDLQAPCGYDMFSYSWRDSPGTLFHCSIGKMLDSFGQGYDPGDVIGIGLHLPPPKKMKDLLKRQWDPRIHDAYEPFPINPIADVEGSSLVFYKNGTCLGVAFENLKLGKYHAAVSCYGGAQLCVNFGPEFEYPVRRENVTGADSDAAKFRPFSEASTLNSWESISYKVRP